MCVPLLVNSEYPPCVMSHKTAIHPSPTEVLGCSALWGLHYAKPQPHLLGDLRGGQKKTKMWHGRFGTDIENSKLQETVIPPQCFRD